jgi:hypothetical protein
MTPERLDELAALAAAAPPGPWRSDGIRIGEGTRYLATATGLSGEPEPTTRQRNAAAHLMAAAPELLAEVMRLRDALEGVPCLKRCDWQGSCLYREDKRPCPNCAYRAKVEEGEGC